MFYTIFFLLLTYYILAYPEVSLYYAINGFSLWYTKMVPSLLPFMILSGVLIRMNLTKQFSQILHPFLKKIFRCSPQISYGIIMGFLCGFPMGAKVASDLFKTGKITKEEAAFLLSFCNNIGPVYFLTFALPLLNIHNSSIYLFAMYGIPFLYGILLRYTYYRKKITTTGIKSTTINSSSTGLLTSLDNSIHSSIQSILMLCGYMIIFNLLNILPHFILQDVHKYISPLLEITGGLNLLNGKPTYYCLMLLSFGGLSCIAQTHSMIVGTGLSIKNYILHKAIISGITGLFYMAKIILN